MPKKTITETLLYPVILHREEDTWGYFSPEFGGGGAPTQSDALKQAKMMIENEIAERTALGEDAPAPKPLEELDADGGIIVSIMVTVSNASERITLTFPSALLAQIDAATDNRSAFLAELARERLNS